MRFLRLLLLSVLVYLLSVESGAAWAANTDIRINSIGYVTTRAKQATIVIAAAAFDIRRATDDSIAFSGVAAGPIADPDTAENTWIADFSALTTSGFYYLSAAGVGRSPTFRIAGDPVYNSLVLQMKGFYGWRCGTAVNLNHRGTTYSHAACHLNDGNRTYVPGGGNFILDGAGGWHDAGDYGKYTVNGAFAAGEMLMAWEHFSPALQTIKLPIPESGGATPDYLAEIRWELEFLLKMQFADGSVSHKLTRIDFEGFIMPELDNGIRYFLPFSTVATSSFAAVMAQASRVYAPYDLIFATKCQNAAVAAFNFMKNHPNIEYAQPQAAGGGNLFQTGAYTDGDYGNRVWMNAEIWEMNGDAGALVEIENNAQQTVTDWDWGNPVPLGQFTYALSNRPGRNQNTLNQVRNTYILGTANGFLNRTRYGRVPSGPGQIGYGWGSNGSVARAVMTLMVANQISPNANYLDAAYDQLSWLYGRNYYGRSMVTGEGVNPPLDPHHRPSIADGVPDPWPGLLVGGGTTATNWVDDRNNYFVNEVALNWNGAMTYALAAFLTPHSVASAQIDSVSPNRGAANTQTVVTIKGSSFAAGATVTIDGVAAVSAVVASSSTVWARLPARPASTISVTVANPAGDTAVLPNAFTYDAGPAQRLFTDDPLAPRSTVVKLLHLAELRDAVNAARRGAGLLDFNFVEAAPTVVKASHITELRNALAPALVAVPVYTDPDPTGVLIKAAHIQEIRNLAR